MVQVTQHRDIHRNWRDLIKPKRLQVDKDTLTPQYGKFFADNPPARATVEAARLPRDARVEIEAIAIAGK